MTEAEWFTATDPTPMLDEIRGMSSDRKLRLFAVACCRRVWDGLVDVRSRTAVEVAERFADGQATGEELQAAHDAAYIGVDDCIHFSVFSEDQAIAAYLSAAADVDEQPDPRDPYPGDVVLHGINYAADGLMEYYQPKQVALLRCIFGNPFRPVLLDPAWLTPTAVAIATGVYQDRAFDRLPILADALEDAGCDSADALTHLRSPGPHARGCWVVDLLLGKA